MVINLGAGPDDLNLYGGFCMCEWTYFFSDKKEKYLASGAVAFEVLLYPLFVKIIQGEMYDSRKGGAFRS